MSSIYHPMTFLRSALAKDPFCLGDLGPEDVLRIEAYFPELFTSPNRPSTSSGKGKTTPSPRPKSASQGNVKDQGPTATSSSRLHSHSAPQRGAKSDGFICSRGSRCGAAATAKATTNSDSKFMKGKIVPEPKQPKRLAPPRDTKLEIVKLFPKNSPMSVQMTKSDFSKVTPRSPELQQKVFVKPSSKDRVSQAQQGTGESTSGVKLISIGQVKSLNKRKPKLSNLLSQFPQSQSISAPAFTSRKTSKKPETVKHEQPNFEKQMAEERQQLAESLQAILSNIVKLPDEFDVAPASAPPLKPAKAKPKPSPGFIRPVFVNPVLRRNLKTRSRRKRSKETIKKSNTDNPPDCPDNVEVAKSDVPKNYASSSRTATATSSSSESNAEKFSIGQAKALLHYDDSNQRFFDMNSAGTSKTSVPAMAPGKSSVTRIQRPLADELIAKDVQAGDQLQTESIDRFEQLMMARMLASKYEKDGRFNKWSLNAKMPTTSGNQASTARTGKDQTKTTTPGSSQQTTGILEKIAEDLIRAEVLNYMHNEDCTPSPSKANKGVGTQLEISDVDYDPMKPRLTPINEEGSEILITPDLTPPLQVNAQKSKSRRRRSKGSSKSASEVSVSTPVPTLPKSAEKEVSKPRKRNRGKNKKVHNDTTDCSSISDFVLSETVNNQSSGKTVGFQKSANVSKVKTPDFTQTSEPQFPMFAKDLSLTLDSLLTPVPTKPNSPRRRMEEEFNAACSGLGTLDKTDMKTPAKSSFADILSDFEKSVTSGFQKLYSEILSEGEFLGVPYKSPGEVSQSVGSEFSPGLYSSDDEFEDDLNDTSWTGVDLDTITEDTTPTTTTLSEGEYRSDKK